MPQADDFDTFYRGSRQRLLSVVYLLTGDSGEAQDAVQEAFVRAWQRWDSIRGYDNPEAWVRMVACRIATSRWRGMRNRLRAHQKHGIPSPVAPSVTPRWADPADRMVCRRDGRVTRNGCSIRHTFALDVGDVMARQLCEGLSTC